MEPVDNTNANDIEQSVANILRIANNTIRNQEQECTDSIDAYQRNIIDSRLEDLEYEIPTRLWNNCRNIDFSGQFKEKYDLLTSCLGKGFTVILHGPAGTGKTQLSVLVAKKACEHYKHVHFTSLLDFKIEVQKLMNNNKSIQSAVKHLAGCGLLILDEIDEFIRPTISGSTYWVDLLFQILNIRYNELRDTILTSNFSHTELDNLLAPKLKSRIVESGGYIDTSLWPNRRIPNKSPLIQQLSARQSACKKY